MQYKSVNKQFQIYKQTNMCIYSGDTNNVFNLAKRILSYRSKAKEQFKYNFKSIKATQWE